MPSVWTPDLVEEARRLHAQGMTMTGIAEALGRGLTKGSVVGKLHRLGALPSRSGAVAMKEIRSRRAGRRDEARHVERRKSVQPRVLTIPRGPLDPDRPGRRVPLAIPRRPFERPLEGHVGLDIMDLRADTCRWPVWDMSRDAARVYCGASAPNGGPYCECHRRVAYRPYRRSIEGDA